MSKKAPEDAESYAKAAYSRKLLILIALSLGTAMVASAAQLIVSNWGNEALATGPIVPLGAVWYVVSNYLCANAVYLYCKDHVPRWILVICWIGLAGGGTDHIIETWTWMNGNHQPFAKYWETATLAGLPMSWFPFVAFGATSVIGIWSAVYVLVRHAVGVSRGIKALLVVWALVAGSWGLVLEPMTMHSTVVWHTTHIFVTHLFLSMLPPYIVWAFSPHLNLFSFMPRGPEPDPTAVGA